MPASIAEAREEAAEVKAWDVWEAEAYPQEPGTPRVYSWGEFDRKCKEFDAWYKAKLEANSRSSA